MKRAIGTIIFLLGYIIFMIPTYLGPYTGSNTYLLDEIRKDGRSDTLNVLIPRDNDLSHQGTVFHAVGSVMTVIVALVRGFFTGRVWIASMSFVAALFDWIPVVNWVPLVPTALHVVTLVIGSRTRQRKQ